jgi:acyl carrier protein
LGLTRIGIRDDFFQAGGNSIMGIRLVSKMNKKFDLSLKITDLFSLRTIEKIAEHAKIRESGEVISI